MGNSPYLKKLISHGYTSSMNPDEWGEASSKEYKKKKYNGFCTSKECCKILNMTKRKGTNVKHNCGIYYSEKKFKTSDEKVKCCPDCGTELIWFAHLIGTK